MGRRIVIIQGNPDPAGGHFGNALAEAYTSEAETAGHEVRRIEVAQLAFPLLRTRSEWERESPAAAIVDAQRAIAWGEHLFIIYPLWLGTMPAILKAFFEQTLRPGFALGEAQSHKMPAKLLKGRSARIVITMGMPALAYRWYFGAHSLKNLRRNILGFCGIGPIRTTLIGMVEANARRRESALANMRSLGARAR